MGACFTPGAGVHRFVLVSAKHVFATSLGMLCVRELYCICVCMSFVISCMHKLLHKWTYVCGPIDNHTKTNKWNLIMIMLRS